MSTRTRRPQHVRIDAHWRPMPKTLRLKFSLGYNISMRSRTVSRFAGHKLSGRLFAFVLSLAQVYPAFATCLCLEVAPTLQATVAAENFPACHIDPGEENPQESAEEMDSESCTTQTRQVAGLSSQTCCGSIAIWASEVRASISRNVETRSSLDAMYIAFAEDTGRHLVRSARSAPLSEAGVFHCEAPPLYLSNASLLI